MFKFGLLIILVLDYSTFVTSRCVGAIESTDPTICYKYSANLQSFNESETSCINLHGHLASIHDISENTFIYETVNYIYNSGSKIWLGGGRIGEDGWKWTDNSPFNFTKWAKGNPNNNGDCISFGSGESLWFSDTCSSRYGYLCKVPSTINGYFCDSGWTYFDQAKSCYLVQHNANWTVAEDVCKNYGAHLASIHSNDENNFIINLSKSGLNGLTHPDTGVWLGMYAIETKTKFAWTDGTTIDYTKWGAGEPDGFGENGVGIAANCIDIHSDLVTGYEGLYETWDDDNCWVSMRAFVCKKPAYAYY